jgi:hypothetical protein
MVKLMGKNLHIQGDVRLSRLCDYLSCFFAAIMNSVKNYLFVEMRQISLITCGRVFAIK